MIIKGIQCDRCCANFSEDEWKVAGGQTLVVGDQREHEHRLPADAYPKYHLCDTCMIDLHDFLER